MFPAKEILDAIQNEADFENTDVEKAIINALETLDKELKFVQYEPGSELEDAITAMNKAIATANSDIDEDEDDEEEDTEDDLILEDEDDDEDEEPLILEDDTTEETEDAQPDPTQK
jgi:hypothetical protein